ncbi:MAG: CDGSH iron-sulfur domain-containing protein [Pelagibacteraceae bacterium]|jgi:CDGSH-type Zn-finger protein
MNNAKTIKNSPEKVSLEKDKKYSWCTCGLSHKQPFCDGTHKTKGDYKSLPFNVNETKDYYLCNCKKTKNPPFCDGSHN